MGGSVRCDDGMHLVFHGLRIHALVHAPAEEAACGTIGNLLPVERASSVASSLHAQELQRGAAVGGPVSGNADPPVAAAFPTGARAVRAGCPAAREKSGAGEGLISGSAIQ